VKNNHGDTKSTEKAHTCRTPPNAKLTDDEERAKDVHIGGLG
jgi:hypothetical protein